MLKQNITDAAAITGVDQQHTYGISYFSLSNKLSIFIIILLYENILNQILERQI